MDGIRAMDGVLTHEEHSDLKLISPLYLGSTPASLHQDLGVIMSDVTEATYLLCN